MPETERVKRALRALALQESRPCGSAPAAADAALLSRATTAVDDVRRAATFREEGCLTELEAAVDRAAERDDDAFARRGREVLGRFGRYRRAARPPVPSDADPLPDHFRSGHGTPLSDAGQSGDR